MEPIKDLEIYNTHMRKSMYDKLWFVDKLPNNISCLYDYGCGDGTLLTMAKQFFPYDLETIGYDNNPEMRMLANGSFWVSRAVDKPLTSVPAGTCLVASSVFHEIYNYSEDVEKELQNIFNIGADYIAIRDMFYDGSNETSSFLDIKKVKKFLGKEKQYMLDQFREEYGNIDCEKNFVHFLLKYRYVENWSRELKENYLPYDISNFLYHVIPTNYEVIYYEAYTLPFLKDQVKKDFGIDLYAHTHAKILLKQVS